MTPILEADDLHVHYGQAPILEGVGLALGAGEVVALLGRNGAGKTTTLRCLMGLVRPSRGRIRLKGRDITALSVHHRARRGIGWVPEDRRVFADLTVLENLEVGRKRPASLKRADALAGLPAWSLERLFDLFPALKPLCHRRGGSLSGGEQQMLSLARTLQGDPEVLLLDEPSEGLAPLVVEQIAGAVDALKRGGVSILMSEQNLPFATAIADRTLTLERGRVVRSSPSRVVEVPSLPSGRAQS